MTEAQAERDYKAGVRHAEEVEAGRETQNTEHRSVWFQRGFAWFYAMLMRYHAEAELKAANDRIDAIVTAHADDDSQLEPPIVVAPVKKEQP